MLETFTVVHFQQVVGMVGQSEDKIIVSPLCPCRGLREVACVYVQGSLFTPLRRLHILLATAWASPGGSSLHRAAPPMQMGKCGQSHTSLLGLNYALPLTVG